MLNSVLLHLQCSPDAESVIRAGVAIASPAEARVRGLTLVDTREMEAALYCESAVYASVEQTRHNAAERKCEDIRGSLSQACLAAGLNFDVRRAAGNPLHVLPLEARFHDLVVTSMATKAQGCDDASGLTQHDLLALLERGVQPILVIHPESKSFKRVLMVYDGSEASSRAIRSFLNLLPLNAAEHRLLAIGHSESQARAAMREMADYCASRRRWLETGCLAGRLRNVLLPYVAKWQADLVVLGIGRENRLWRWLRGDAALEVWRKLPCGLFVAG